MPAQYILKVSELTKKVRFLLESELNTVWLTGEISNLVCASSGHWYLSLKDSQSQVRCAMFKNQAMRVRIKPKNGQQVLVKAKVSLYEPRGDFQLIIEQMDDAGEGLLQQKYQVLKQKLTVEGLFDLGNKRQLPTDCQTIGIITSPTGAAIRDVITVLKRRNPRISIIIYPTLVQGTSAAPTICQAIQLANQRHECELLLLTRGGGSLEDLWCFNDESVVRAIANSHLPIISAVGHETDTTLADYASDLRAATPSAGAELASSEQQHLQAKLLRLQQQIIHQCQHKLQLGQHQQTALMHRLTRLHPERQYQLQQQKNDDFSNRLNHAMLRSIAYQQQGQQQWHERLMQQSAQQKITQYSQQLSKLTHQLNQAMRVCHQHKSLQFSYLIEQLQLVSPLATIARGYAIVRDQRQQVIKHSQQVSHGDKLSIQVTDGVIYAKVDTS